MLGVVPGLTPEKPTDWLGRQTGVPAIFFPEGIHRSFLVRADNRYFVMIGVFALPVWEVEVRCTEFCLRLRLVMPQTSTC